METTFIEGDNLDVLHALAGEGELFDLVYIDPPYNTGSLLAYRDRRNGTAGTHAAWTDWLRPRLLAAREVMSPRAAIYVSIDDHEVAYLRLLLDEVFGEAGFLAQIVVNLNPKGRQLGPGFATVHEYLLVYARDPRACALVAASPDAVDPAHFPYVDELGRAFRRLPLRNSNKKFNPGTSATLHYPLYVDEPTGRVSADAFDGAVEIWPVFGDGTPAVWRWSPSLVRARTHDLVARRINGRLGSRLDVFQLDWLDGPDGARRSKKLRTIWTSDEIGSTDVAMAELTALIGPVFDSPKPTGLIRRILATMPADARVLDFFAGSGTTAHAVALANRADDGKRTCVLVKDAEPVRPGTRAAAAGYRTVADITRARLAAVERVLG